MHGNNFASDDESAGKHEQAEVRKVFFLKADEKLAKTVDKRVSDFLDPSPCFKVGVSFQFQLFFAARPDVRDQPALFHFLLRADELTKGYALSSAQTVMVEAGKTAEVKIEYKLQRGSLKIVKTFEGKDSPIAGVPFLIISQTAVDEIRREPVLPIVPDEPAVPVVPDVPGVPA